MWGKEKGLGREVSNPPPRGGLRTVTLRPVSSFACEEKYSTGVDALSSPSCRGAFIYKRRGADGSPRGVRAPVLAVPLGLRVGVDDHRAPAPTTVLSVITAHQITESSHGIEKNLQAPESGFHIYGTCKLLLP